MGNLRDVTRFIPRRSRRWLWFTVTLALLAGALQAQQVPPTGQPPPPSGKDAQNAERRETTQSTEEEEKVSVDADEVEFDRKANIIRARGNVVIRRGDVKITADRAEYNTETKIAIAEGNVHLRQPGEDWRGPMLTYDFSQRRGVATEFRGFNAPWYMAGRKAEKAADHFVILDGYVTTCEYNKPHYRLKASRVDVYPDERIEARNVVLYVGSVPVFWLPYISQPLKDKRGLIEIVPGHSGRMGFYVLGAYNWFAGDSLRGTVHADYRSRRGPGVGLDFEHKLGPNGEGWLKTYYTDDARPKDDDDADKPIGHSRYRIQFQHRQQLGDSIVATTRMNNLSDPDILDDFFEEDYQKETQPDSFADVTLTRPTYTVSLLARPQINSFFETTERLPELQLTAVRQPVFGSPVFYEGETSVGYLQRSFTPNSGSAGFDSVRADSFHQFLYPMVWGGWLSVVSRAGGRVTFYGDSPTTGSPSVVRGVFNTGAEISTKAARKFEVSSAALDINGLRHIIEPSLLYSYVPTPNRRPRELWQFDTDRPTTRLLPLEFPHYRNIDSIDAINTLRPRLRNRLQTRRSDGRIVDLVDWTLFADWRIDKPEGLPRYSDIFSDLRLRPCDWLFANVFLRLHPDEGTLQELNTDVGLVGSTNWAIALGGRLLRGDSNLISGDIYARLSPNWAVRICQRVDAHDGRWEEQEYTVERDLHCWTAALSFRYRDGGAGRGDFRVFLALTLKALPDFRVSVGK